MQSVILRQFVHSMVAFAAVLSVTLSAPAQTSDDVRVETLISGLDHPWSFAPLNPTSGLITERDSGRLLYWSGDQIRELKTGLDIDNSGQGGLLDVLYEPANRWVFLTFATPGTGGASTALARGTLTFDASGTPQLNDVRTIFEAAPKTRGGRHFGSRLAIGGDGKLYMSLGDRGDFMEQAQNVGNHIGTVVRLNLDGTVPADNPFVGQAGARAEIYSYGHRNPQGMAVHPTTGIVWANEHGPRGGDEVNVLRAGANFGWPTITYGIDYDGSVISDQTAALGMEQPVTYWSPSIAPSGMAFSADGTKAYVGALRGAHLSELTLGGVNGQTVLSERQLLGELRARIRDVRLGQDGALYVLTDDSAPDGALLRVTVP